MARENLTDLLAFAAVAQEGSFTRAAKRLGPTQSALSHTMNGLEARLGLAPAGTVPWPALRRVLTDYPEIAVEIGVDAGLTDIVAQRIDAGVRFGGPVAKDMTAIRIGPDMRIAVVGSPTHFQSHRKPDAPQDLIPDLDESDSSRSGIREPP